jgi:hypothetical protein
VPVFRTFPVRVLLARDEMVAPDIIKKPFWLLVMMQSEMDSVPVPPTY